jgi:Ca2+-binding RTX toxin-like protein
MPTFVAGTIHGVDFGGLEYGGGGDFTAGNTTHLTVAYPNSATAPSAALVTADFLGQDFSYQQITPTPRVIITEFISGGPVTSYDQVYQGQVIFSSTDLNQPIYTPGQAATSLPNVVNYLLAGPDTISGSPFTDHFFSRDSNDSLAGLGGDDELNASGGNDSLDGGAGNDTVDGSGGADSVTGGDGADLVRGGDDNDAVFGGAGDDPHVNGNKGNDVVHGGDGNDTVYGGQGNDTVYGDDGNDSLSGDRGNDILYGGFGADRFGLAVGGGQDWVADFHAVEGDHVVLPTGAQYTVANYQGQVLITLSSGDSIGLAGVAFATFSGDWIVSG